MLGLAERTGAKILQAFAGEGYRDPTSKLRIVATTLTHWNHLPAATKGKRCAELCFNYFRQYRVRIKFARIINTYGPRMRPYGCGAQESLMIWSRHQRAGFSARSR